MQARAPIDAGGESVRQHWRVHFSCLHIVSHHLLVSSMSAPNVLNAVSRWAIPVFVGVSLAQSALYDVRGGSRAVIFDRLSGVQEKVVNEGTHFLIPWLQKAIIYDVRTKPRNISTTTGSKDLQMVSLTLRVLHRPEVQMLPKIYQVSALEGDLNYC
jgi:regulator of protease activity HflC (stomatin/prohibitin superfamily)